MGQKVHPVGIRLGITKEWSSRWYANTQTFPDYVEQDHRIREFLRKKLKEASISRIHIERQAKKANITIHTARPGVVIGKKGEDIEKLRGEVALEHHDRRTASRLEERLMKSKDQLKDYRAKSDAELGEELLKLRREQFNLRMQAAAGHGAKPDQHGKVRKSIARLKTLQRERVKNSE